MGQLTWNYFALYFILKSSVLPWKQATTWAWRRREQNWFLLLEAWKFRKTEVKGRGNYKAIWLPCVLREARPSLPFWLSWKLLILILFSSVIYHVFYFGAGRRHTRGGAPIGRRTFRSWRFQIAGGYFSMTDNSGDYHKMRHCLPDRNWQLQNPRHTVAWRSF